MTKKAASTFCWKQSHWQLFHQCFSLLTFITLTSRQLQWFSSCWTSRCVDVTRLLQYLELQAFSWGKQTLSGWQERWEFIWWIRCWWKFILKWREKMQLSKTSGSLSNRTWNIRIFLWASLVDQFKSSMATSSSLSCFSLSCSSMAQLLVRLWNVDKLKWNFIIGIFYFSWW